MLPSLLLYVGMDVNQYIHQGAAQSQTFMTTINSKTNMATVEEIMIMFKVSNQLAIPFLKKFLHCYFFFVSH